MTVKCQIKSSILTTAGGYSINILRESRWLGITCPGIFYKIMKKHGNIQMEVDYVGPLERTNKVDLKKIVNNIVLDVFIICQIVRHV